MSSDSQAFPSVSSISRVILDEFERYFKVTAIKITERSIYERTVDLVNLMES